MYKRILLKLSGEALMGKQNYGIDAEQLEFFADEISNVYKEGTQIGIVIGGGNIFRGISGASKGFDRIDGDYLGMLATVMNGLALKSELEKNNLKVIVLSGIEISPLCAKMHSKTAINYIEQGYIVIISGGTGNPFFTTDTAAALRSVEIKANVLLKGTRVDGVYDKDPEKFNDAIKFDTISYDEAYEKKLNIMDLTAFTLCKENNIPTIVFNMNKKGNLKKVVTGEKIGSVIK